MNNKLKEITDLTVNELLSQDIIFPSNYLQCFDKHAKLINIDINDEFFEKEIDDILLNEFNNINKYIIEATKTVEQKTIIENGFIIKIYQKRQHLKIMQQ